MAINKDHNLNTRSIFMLPWLAHGHISPFFELAKKLTKKNFFIYFCSTPTNLTSVKNQLGDINDYANSIKLVELHLPPLPQLPPNHYTTNGLPLHLHPTLAKALDMAEPELTQIIITLKPDLVIHDFAIPWCAEVSASLKIPNITFSILGAAMHSFFCHMMTKYGTEYPFPAIYLRDYEQADLIRKGEAEAQNGITSRKNGARSFTASLQCDVMLIKSLTEIEGKYIDYFSVLTEKKILPVGPLIGDTRDESGSSDIIEWLDQKDPFSTVFVSFGSEYFLSKEERTEIAHGLELSSVNFIWVIRFPIGEEMSAKEALPEGFLERVGGKGRVVEGWAPQAKILSHENIGGFVSHCGWSSVIESINACVPIIALPMHVDQPLNARVVEEVGVGVEVKRDKNGNIEREEFGKVLRQVVGGESKIGDNLRMKERKFMEKMKLNGEEEIDVVVRELLQLCPK